MEVMLQLQFCQKFLNLSGYALLSPPANSKGNAIKGVSSVDVPAFFAVSNNDPGGKDFYPQVKSLYEASVSPKKELYVLKSYEHGTDLLYEEDKYSAIKGSTPEEKQERRELSERLIAFVNECFGKDTVENDGVNKLDETTNMTNIVSEGETEKQVSNVNTFVIVFGTIILLIICLYDKIQKNRKT